MRHREAASAAGTRSTEPCFRFRASEGDVAAAARAEPLPPAGDARGTVHAASIDTSTPPAVGRGRGTGLTQSSNPRGLKADVAYVPSTENRRHGSVLGTKLCRLCDGTRFKYVFY
jgi:hypothetical protein